MGKEQTKSPSRLSERAIKVIRLGLRISFFRTGLRRWRSVFLCPTTGYLTRVCKSAFCGCRKLFFRAPASLMRASSQRSTGTQKNTQLPLSAFACFRDPDRIRTCDPQLRRLLLYPAELPDQSFSLEIRRADVERGCKGNAFFLFCK